MGKWPQLEHLLIYPFANLLPENDQGGSTMGAQTASLRTAPKGRLLAILNQKPRLLSSRIVTGPSFIK